MATLYIAAGLNHFRYPGMYSRIMPPYIPYHSTMIYLSGFLEVTFGVLLFSDKTRQFAAWGIIALLIAVFPANIQMLVNYIKEGNTRLWIAVIRLPLQLVLIWWAYTLTKNKTTT